MNSNDTDSKRPSRIKTLRRVRIVIISIWLIAVITSMVVVPLYGFSLLPEVELYKHSRNRSIMMAAIILGILPYVVAAIGSKIVFKLTNTTEGDIWSKHN